MARLSAPGAWNELMDLLELQSTEESPEVFLRRMGHIFAVFGEPTQDSGNISYGVRIGDRRYFVKTAGLPDNSVPYFPHPERVALLRNAIQLAHGCSHLALPRLCHVIESAFGPLLIYEWVDGELLSLKGAEREDPRSALRRFRRLPVEEIMRALDAVFEPHHELAMSGWIAVDFYHGSLIYDFARQRMHVVDLDHYHKGPLRNEMGRMFGSSRFMAPEEFQLGAGIDERTNVFTMGRAIAMYLSDGTLERAPFRGTDVLYETMLRACRECPDERFPSMAAFWSAWCDARGLPFDERGRSRSERREG